MHSAQGTEQCVNTWQMFSQGDLVVVFFLMQTIIKGQWLLIVGLLANKCLSKEYRHPI